MFARLRGPRPSFFLLLGVLSVTAVLAAGCGDDDDSTETGDSAGPSTTADSGASSTTETPAEPDVPAGLAGTSWDLTSITGPAGDVPVVAESGASITFAADGTFSARPGCNQLSGTYESADDTLTLSPGPMTRMACTDPAVTAQEDAVVERLSAVASATIDDGTLTMADAEGDTLLTWTAADTSIEGTTWTVTGVNNGNDAVETSELTEALTAEFGADGTFSGNGGCNQLSGSYELRDPDGISVGPLASTMMACDDDVTTVEQRYVAALEAASTYTVEGDTLTLRDADGAIQVTAQRAS